MSSRDTALNIPIRGNKMSGRSQILDVPRASVYLAAPGLAAIASGANPAATWNTLEYQTESMWDVANPTQLVIRTAGLYDCVASWGWPLGAAITLVAIGIRKNGTTVYGDRTSGANSVAGTVYGTSAQIPLNASDYIEVIVLQINASGPPAAVVPLNSTATQRENGFQACLIST